jgi:circadian clock protein KaiB
VPRAKPVREILKLRLYVAGNAPNSVRAIANAKLLCESHFTSAYEMEIVDLMEHPLRAASDGVIVTPTLLKLAPLPVARLIGNLSDAAGALEALGGR